MNCHIIASGILVSFPKNILRLIVKTRDFWYSCTPMYIKFLVFEKTPFEGHE